MLSVVRGNRLPCIPMTTLSTAADKLLHEVCSRAKAAGVFGDVSVQGGMLRCAAAGSAQPAEYRLFVEKGVLWVALVTEHRWLSQSIEADLVHTGDKLNELIEEELINLGWEGFSPTFEHFRDDHKLYTFRTRLTPPLDLGSLDTPAAAETVEKATTALLAYEGAFRPLGDMEADEDQ
jgi:hypothetical protein